MARFSLWASTLAACGALALPAAAQSAVTLETAVDAATTRVVLRPLGTSRTSEARLVATISHRAGAPPMGALSPDGRTLALLTVPPGGEPRRRAELVLLDVASGRSRTLLRELQQVPPAWSADARTVFVVRSYPMPPPTEAEARRGRLEDERLGVQAVRSADGTAREACVDVAYVLHPIGVAAATGELVVIRVSWQGASIRAIDPASCRSRDLAADPGDALRDAHLDTHAEHVIYLRRRARGHDATVERVAVSGGAATIVAHADDRAMPLPVDDGIAFTSAAALVVGRARLAAREGSISAIASSRAGVVVVHRTTANGHAYSVLVPGTTIEHAWTLDPHTTLSVAGFVGDAR